MAIQKMLIGLGCIEINNEFKVPSIYKPDIVVRELRKLFSKTEL